MLLDLVKALEGIQLDYTLVSLQRLDVPFDSFVCIVTITDIYSCYIVEEGEVVDLARFNTVQSIVDYITYIDCSYIEG